MCTKKARGRLNKTLSFACKRKVAVEFGIVFLENKECQRLGLGNLSGEKAEYYYDLMSGNYETSLF